MIAAVMADQDGTGIGAGAPERELWHGQRAVAWHGKGSRGMAQEREPWCGTAKRAVVWHGKGSRGVARQREPWCGTGKGAMAGKSAIP